MVADTTTRARQGGAVWALLQYVIGFRRLGHEVHLLDQLQVDEIGPDDLRDFDVVLNTSGSLAPDSIAPIPIRVYLDLDPAFNQLWHLEGIDRRFAGHTHFVTVGLGIGRDSCSIQTLGLPSIQTSSRAPLTTIGASFAAHGPKSASPKAVMSPRDAAGSAIEARATWHPVGQ